MHYRLVYDVLNARFPWFGVLLASVPLLLAIGFILQIVERVRGKPLPRMPGKFPLGTTPLLVDLISFVILAAAGAFMTSHVWNAYVQRKECQQWVRAGQFEVTEGTITDYQFRKAGPSFRVAALTFDLSHTYAGFTGRFNVPRDAESYLWNGMRVRLAHRSGFILRLEIQSAQEAVANRASD